MHRPLAFSAATLWPPLAWAMISGLIASTVLTLAVVPALYKVLFSWPPLRGLGRRRPAAAAAALLLCASLAFAERSAAAEAAVSLTLEEAMEQAAARPQAAAAAWRARAAELEARAVRRAALWPSVGTAADVVRRDRDFDTPLGALTLGDRTSTSLALRVDQPLFDPVRRLYAAPAARSAADAARWSAARTRQELAAQAGAAYLAVLEIDAASRSTESFVASLERRLEEMEARVQAGRVLEADALKIRLDLESAELDRRRLRDLRGVALEDLGRAVGADGPVEPAPPEEVDRGLTPALDEAVETALAARPDVAAVKAQVQALGLRAQAVKAEGWPRFTATLTYQRSDGDPFFPEELATGAVGVSWSLFAAGTRGPRAAAVEAEAEALRAELAELRRGVRLELTDALARLATARAAVAVRARGVELATETLRVERERHGAGRSTTNDLLDAEAALRRQRTERDLARLEVLRAWISYDLAVGGALR